MATEISQLIQEGVARLARVTDQPRHEAEILLAAALGKTRAYLLANPDWSYSVAVPCALLDQQLQAGRAQITSRIALFDAAAERALSRLDPR